MRAPWQNATGAMAGVAISTNRLVARRPRRGRSSSANDRDELWVRPLTLAADGGEPWTDLTEALGELRDVMGAGRGALYVALIPPLAQLRRLELPGVSEREATRVVNRDPSRFLPSVRGKQVIVELEGAGWRRTSPFSLVVVPQPVLAAIGSAARAAGWSLGGVVAAPRAWAAAAASGGRRDACDLVLCLESHIELVRVENEFVRAVRRVPIALKTADPSTVLALLAERGIDVGVDARVISSADEAAALAAAFAPYARGASLLPDAERQVVRQRRRRAAIARFVAAAALVVGAAALELRGLARERNTIAAGRARIRTAVAHAIAVRESIAVSRDRLAAVRSIEGGATRWSALVAALADGLPSDAFLVSLDAGGDSLHLEGAAARAAPVFEALTRVPGVRSVRPDGPIRQEVRGGDAMSEHFVLAALLTRGDSSRNERPSPNGNGGGTLGRQP